MGSGLDLSLGYLQTYAAKGLTKSNTDHAAAKVRDGVWTDAQARQWLDSISGGGGGEGGGSEGFESNYESLLKYQGQATRDYIQAQVDAYKQNREWMAENELRLYKELAPQYAQSMKDALDKMYPYQSGLGEQLAKEVSGRLSEESYAIPDALRRKYEENLRGSASARGLLRSGMSSLNEADTLTRLGLQLREADKATALSLASGVPKATMPGAISGSVPQVNDYYASTLGAATSLTGMENQMAIAQMQNNMANQELAYRYWATNQQDSGGGTNFLGGLLGTTLGAFGGGFGSGLAGKFFA